MFRLDEYDLKILTVLQHDGRTTNPDRAAGKEYSSLQADDFENTLWPLWITVLHKINQ